MDYPKLIGLDFDNTVVDYTEIIADIAKDYGFVGGNKASFRQHLLNSVEGDIAWQKVQAMIYGSRILDAKPMDGLFDFLSCARRNNVIIKIISHKTEYSSLGLSDVSLRMSAMKWLDKYSVFSTYGLLREDVFFANTQIDKITEISRSNVEVFVDDLKEILLHELFPVNVKRILIDPLKNFESQPFDTALSFVDVRNIIFSD
jgi:hypothetical protein